MEELLLRGWSRGSLGLGDAREAGKDILVKFKAQGHGKARHVPGASGGSRWADVGEMRLRAACEASTLWGRGTWARRVGAGV